MATTHSFADIIASWLVDAAYGNEISNATWPVSVNSQPDEPDSAICVYDQPGRMQGRLMGTGAQLEKPGFLIRVRAFDYDTAVSKAKDIAAALDGINRTTVIMAAGNIAAKTYVVHAVSRQTAPLPIGVEQEREPARQLVTLNAIGTVVQSP